MVGGLMDHQPARVGLVAVPAPVVIRPVVRIQQPVEINRQHLADHPRHQQFLDLGARRGIAVVEGDPALTSCLALGIDDALAFFSVGGHWFFGDHIAAQLHRPADIFVVGAVFGSHDHHVGPGFADHAFEIICQVGFYLDPALVRQLRREAAGDPGWYRKRLPVRWFR